MTSELIFCTLILTRGLSVVPLLTVNSIHSLLWCTVQPLHLFSLPEEPVTIQQDTPVTDLILPCFTYASNYKSLGLGQVYLPRAACISVETSQVSYTVGNTSWSCCKDPISACSHNFCHTIPLFIAGRADLVSYQACLYFYQWAVLASLCWSSSVLEVFFRSELHPIHGLTACKVDHLMVKTPKTIKNLSDYTSLSIADWSAYQCHPLLPEG